MRSQCHGKEKTKASIHPKTTPPRKERPRFVLIAGSNRVELRPRVHRTIEEEISRCVHEYLPYFKRHLAENDHPEDAVLDCIAMMLSCGAPARWDPARGVKFKTFVFGFVHRFVMKRRCTSARVARLTTTVVRDGAYDRRETPHRVSERETAVHLVSLLRSRLDDVYGETLDAMMRTNFNPARAAAVLGVNRPMVYTRMRFIQREAHRLGIAPTRIGDKVSD